MRLKEQTFTWNSKIKKYLCYPRPIISFLSPWKLWGYSMELSRNNLMKLQLSMPLLNLEIKSGLMPRATSKKYQKFAINSETMIWLISISDLKIKKQVSLQHGSSKTNKFLSNKDNKNQRLSVRKKKSRKRNKNKNYKR